MRVLVEAEVRERPEVLRAVLDQLATCANMISEAVQEGQSGDEFWGGIKFHYGMQGLEFETMRAAWLLGDKETAARLHPIVGDHSPECCPVCSGVDAYAAGVAVPEAEETPPAFDESRGWNPQPRGYADAVDAAGAEETPQ